MCRRVAVRVANGKDGKTRLTACNVKKFLGVQRHWAEELLNRNRIGVATGLAWTAAGGDLMFIEALALPGRGASADRAARRRHEGVAAQAATVLRSLLGCAESIRIARRKGHPHPRSSRLDSQGWPFRPASRSLTAIVSLLAERPVDRRVALTGEITLRGEVLPIGGVKEKVLAARGAGVEEVVLPKLNERDVAEIAPNPTSDEASSSRSWTRWTSCWSAPSSSRPTPPTERELLAWLREQPETRGLLGDDCAFLPPTGDTAVTVDRQAAGIHLPHDADTEIFARRLIEINVSDLAACGARPAWAFLGVAGPTDHPWTRFFSAFLDAAESRSVTLAGGDVSRSDEFSATLTLIGHPLVRGRWLRRSAAVPDDSIWVGGALGGSAIGLALARRGGRIDRRLDCHLPEDLPEALSADAERCLRLHFCPQAQTDLAGWLAGHGTCAIDLSDGLSTDLRHLAQSSRVGATIHQDRIDLEPDLARLAAHLELDPGEVVLHGGEDYKLLFTLPEGVEPPAEFGCRRIGEATSEGGRLQIESRGRLRDLPDAGWDQFGSPWEGSPEGPQPA